MSAPDIATRLDPGFAVVIDNSRQGVVGDFESIAGPGGPEIQRTGLRTCAAVSGDAELLRGLD